MTQLFPVCVSPAGTPLQPAAHDHWSSSQTIRSGARHLSMPGQSRPRTGPGPSPRALCHRCSRGLVFDTHAETPETGTRTQTPPKAVFRRWRRQGRSPAPSRPRSAALARREFCLGEEANVPCWQGTVLARYRVGNTGLFPRWCKLGESLYCVRLYCGTNGNVCE